MARIPDEELERLKREIDLIRLVEAKGVVLQRRGSDLVGCCPFHDDRDPSLVVTPGENLWHCMGECQAGGSVVDWVMRSEGVSFRHAVELLRAGPRSAALSPGVARRTGKRRLEMPVEVEAGDSELMAQVVGYYHERLKESEQEGLRYLAFRGLRDRELIDHFRLGYADRTLGLRLPARQWKTGTQVRDRLQELGIYRESGHEHFNGCVVVPIFSEGGEVVGMYGRRVQQAIAQKVAHHLYLPGPHRGVWNWEGVAASGGEVILCEALIDALTLWSLGYRNVTSSYGTEGFTAEHLEAFRRHGVRRVLIAYDRDQAGDRAAVQLAVQLVGAGMDAYRLQLPQGQDVNEYAREQWGTAQERMAQVIRKAVWLGKGQVPRAALVSAPIAGQVVAEPTPIVPEVAVTPAEEVIVATATAGEDLVATPAMDVIVTDVEDLVDAEEVADPDVLPSAAEAAPVRRRRVYQAIAGTAATVRPPGELPPAPAATPAPLAPVEVAAEVNEREVVIVLGDRRWRVRGLERMTSYDLLRVNLLVSREEVFHVDTLDLYSARARAVYLKQAGDELGVREDVLKADLGRVLLHLERLVDEQVRAAQAPRTSVVQLTEEEEREALQWLRDPGLMERILSDFELMGLVGEATNKQVAYLAATSRLLEQPLAVVVQSSTAAGKSALLEAVLALIPEEGRVKYSAMTGQSLYYMAEQELSHKVLALVEEEGAERAAYALKLLQSEGELSIASTGKDPQTGRLVTQEYRVEGPVAIFLTTTAIDLDEELLNRCLVLTVDEDREQTRAIHARQRRRQTLAGLLEDQERERVLRVHRNAQRLLRPLLVVNPYAERLTFADERTRTRRDHMKYLTLIRTVALLHQHQRPVRTAVQGGRQVAYIEVTRADIEVANRLAHEVLGRSLDELPPQARRLLLRLAELAGERCRELELDRSDFRFSRREVREWTGWGDTQLRCHLGRLVEMEYLVVHRGGRGQSFVYELAWDGGGLDGQPHLDGLISASELEYDSNLAGSMVENAGPSRPQRGVIAGRSRERESISPPVQAWRPGRKRTSRGNGHRPDVAVHEPVLLTTEAV